MTITKEDKKWIDGMTYQEMLELWRFAPTGYKPFLGETGIYFGKVMQKKKEKIGSSKAAEISKLVGWAR